MSAAAPLYKRRLPFLLLAASSTTKTRFASAYEKFRYTESESTSTKEGKENLDSIKIISGPVSGGPDGLGLPKEIQDLLASGAHPGHLTIRMTPINSPDGGGQKDIGTVEEMQKLLPKVGSGNGPSGLPRDLEELLSGPPTVRLVPLGSGPPGGDMIDEILKELDSNIAGTMNNMLGLGHPKKHPCDAILEKVCPDVQRSETQKSIHCLAEHRESNSPECENTIKNSLPYLCHREMQDLCNENRADPFDVSPLTCLRNALEKDVASGTAGGPSALVSGQCKEAMDLTHKFVNGLNAADHKISIVDKNTNQEVMQLDPHAGHSIASLDAAARSQQSCLLPLGCLLIFVLLVSVVMNKSPVFRTRVEAAVQNVLHSMVNSGNNSPHNNYRNQNVNNAFFTDVMVSPKGASGSSSRSSFPHNPALSMAKTTTRSDRGEPAGEAKPLTSAVSPNSLRKKDDDLDVVL
ncbi:unnamed protein product [Amoebophrya sp. A120]|nr:unnamed protein product [Amoebophrya sp. A120]|eukprot:GSA120T00014142001.1